MQQSAPLLGEDCTVTIVEMVAEKEGVDQSELPPLYEILDPDILEQLAETAVESVTIQFTYCGYQVVVDGAGQVGVTELADEIPETNA